MLVKPTIEKLLPKTENRYTLSILVAKRARQLVDGALPLYQSESPNLVTVACEELGADRIRCVRGQVSPYIPLRPEIEAARLAARNAAAQADMAEAVREEIERTGAMMAEPMDASDVQIISDALLEEETEDVDSSEQQMDEEQAIRQAVVSDPVESVDVDDLDSNEQQIDEEQVILRAVLSEQTDLDDTDLKETADSEVDPSEASESEVKREDAD